MQNEMIGDGKWESYTLCRLSGPSCCMPTLFFNGSQRHALEGVAINHAIKMHPTLGGQVGGNRPWQVETWSIARLPWLERRASPVSQSKGPPGIILYEQGQEKEIAEFKVSSTRVR